MGTTTPPLSQDPTQGSSAASPKEQNHAPDPSREATELTQICEHYAAATASHDVAGQGTAGSSIKPRPDGGLKLLWYELGKFWGRQISVVVPHDSCRDHLALERTFLGYLRTSGALSMLGVTVAQLFRLQHSPTPNPIFGFYVLGKPLACICQGAAIYTLLLGAYRTWRIQNAIVRGKAITGGFEIVLLWVGVVVICLLFFVLLVAVDISKED